MARPTRTHAFVQSTGKLLVGEMPDEDGVQLLEQWSEPHESTVISNAIDERHQLAMLAGELFEHFCEREAHGAPPNSLSFCQFPGESTAMGKRNLRVEDVMSRDLFTLGRNDKLSVADDLMKQKRVRHIPVLDGDGALAGIITQRDLFRGILLKSLGYGSRAEERLLESLLIKDAMHEDVITTTPDTPLADAARLMMEKKIGCLPVVADGELVGLISEADFVEQFARDDA